MQTHDDAILILPDVEAGILGCFIVDPETHYNIENLTSEMFHGQINAMIFAKMKTFFETKRKIDLITITAELPEHAVYITRLTANIGGTHHIGEYVGKLIETFCQRQVLKKITRMHDQILHSDIDIEDIASQLNSFGREVDNIISGKLICNSFFDLAEASKQAFMERIQARQAGNKIGVPIPFPIFQENFGGFHPGNLIYLGGRPGTGKTALSLFLAMFAAKHGCKTLFFSLEMTEGEIIDRILCAEADIDPVKWRIGVSSDYDFKAVEEVQRQLNSLKLLVVDKPSLKVSQISAICRRERPDIVFLDYLQLCSPERDLKNRNIELGESSQKLKEIAKEFHIPIVANVQLNRNLESRMDKTPRLSDLRDSGSLEQDADIVILLFKPEKEEVLELHCEKNRHGVLGDISLSYNRFYNQFVQGDLIPLKEEF